MFCEKCGCFVEGEQTLCSQCAAEQAAQAENTAGNAVPADDTFELNSFAPTEPQKAPRKKRGWIAAIVAAVIVVACALVAVFNIDSIQSFVDRTFKSPEDYFVDVQKTALAEYSEELTANYGKLLNQSLNGGAAENSAAEAEISVTLGDELLSLLESAMAQQGMDFDVAWLQNIRLTMNANVQDSTMQMILSAALGKNKLLSADVIMDTEGNKIYAAVPELNKDYLVMDASDVIAGGDLESVISQSNAMSNRMIKALPSQEVLNNLINTYAEIALSGINDVQKDTKTVEVGEASQKMVVLTAKITEAELLDIFQDILKEARDDRDLEKVLDDLGEFYSEYYYLEVDLSQELQAAIDEALADLEAAKDQADRKNYMKLKTYVDMKNNVRGYELSVYEDGQEVMDPISWITAVKGKTTYTEAELGEIEIIGEETQSKSVSEGFYELHAEGSEVFAVEFEIEEGTCTTLRFVPGDELMSQMLSETGLPAAMMSGSVALELSYGTDEADKSFCQLSILVGSKPLISMDLSAKPVSGGSITVPSNAIDIQSADGSAQWLANVNFDSLFTALENADVPQALVDGLRSYASLMQYQLP